MSGSKLCTGCNRKLPLESFYRRSASKDGRMYKCKPCEKANSHRYAGDVVESEHNQRVYGNTIEMMRKRFGNG